MRHNIIIRPQAVHGIVHGCFAKRPFLSWFHEARPANFYQGLSPSQIAKGSTGAAAVWLSAVLCSDERRAVAPQWQACFTHENHGGAAEGAGQGRGLSRMGCGGRVSCPLTLTLSPEGEREGNASVTLIEWQDL